MKALVCKACELHMAFVCWMLAVELYETFAVVCPTNLKSLGCWVSYLDKRVAQVSLTVHTLLPVNFMLILVTFLSNISFFLLSCLATLVILSMTFFPRKGKGH